MTEAMFQMIVQGGSFALLAFAMLWAVTKGLPARDRAFIEAQDRQRIDHEKAQALQRADHRDIQERDRTTFETSLNRICVAHDKRTDAITSRLDRLLREPA